METKIREMNVEQKLKDLKLEDLKNTAIEIEQKLKVDLSVAGSKISEIGNKGMLSARDCGIDINEYYIHRIDTREDGELNLMH